MEITNSVLKHEIDEVLNSGQTSTNFVWEAEIHISDDVVLKPLKVNAVTIARNYSKSFADETSLEILIPLGKYARQIYPNRDNLQITLTKKDISENGDALDATDLDITTERYTAYLIGGGVSPTDMQGMESNSEDALDLMKIVTVKFQLIDKAIAQLRMTQTGGVFTNTKLDQLMLSLITTASKNILVGSKRLIEEVNILPISNKEIKAQVVLPHGTPLVEVPGTLQKKIGVYSSGLGSYIQDGCWYVFYLYDVHKFENRHDTLTMIILPKNKFSNIERTFLETNGSKIILVTGETGFIDDNSTQYVNDGNGVRFADSAKLMDSTTKTKGNKTVMSRGKLNTEVVIDKRKDGVNYAPSNGNKITANNFATFSDLNSRGGGIFICMWQSSDPSFLTPGMAIKILYDDSGDIKEYLGILLGVEYVSLGLGGIAENRFSNQCRLHLFVKKNFT